MAYAVSTSDLSGRMGGYIAQILGGANPGSPEDLGSPTHCRQFTQNPVEFFQVADFCSNVGNVLLSQSLDLGAAEVVAASETQKFPCVLMEKPSARERRMKTRRWRCSSS